MALTKEENILGQLIITNELIISLLNDNKQFMESDYFKGLKSRLLRQYLPKIGVDNQGTLLILLYSMLVIPKELLFEKYAQEFDNLNDFIINELALEKSSTYKKDEAKIDCIRHIRNAVAHGKIEFLPSDWVSFTDKNERTKESFSIKIKLAKIPKLLNKLQEIANLYLTFLSSKS